MEEEKENIGFFKVLLIRINYANIHLKRGYDISVFLFFHSIGEEKECGTSIGLFFVVAVCETSIKVIAFSCEDLDLIELFKNELNECGCTLLETRDSICSSLFLKLSLKFLDVFYVLSKKNAFIIPLIREVHAFLSSSTSLSLWASTISITVTES